MENSNFEQEDNTKLNENNESTVAGAVSSSSAAGGGGGAGAASSTSVSDGGSGSSSTKSSRSGLGENQQSSVMENSNFEQEDNTKLNQNNKSLQRESIVGFHDDEDLNCDDGISRYSVLQEIEFEGVEKDTSRSCASMSRNEKTNRPSRRALKVVVKIVIALIQCRNIVSK